MDGIKERLLKDASPEAREALERLIEHEKLVELSRSVELSAQASFHVYRALDEQVRRLSIVTTRLAHILVFQVVSIAGVLLAVHLLTRGIFQ